MPEWMSLEVVAAWTLPLAFVLLGAILGVFFERVVVARLRPLADRTEWGWLEVVLLSLRRAPTLLFTAAGAWAALQLLPMDPQVQSILESLLMVLVLLTLTLVAARATGEGIHRYAARQGTFLPSSSLVTNMVKLVILVIGGLIILQNLDIAIAPLLGALGLGGLAVALALQPSLANTFAGFQIIATRQVREGDYIQLASGEEGYVVDIRWRNTTIRSALDDFQIIVPNSKLAETILTNYSLPSRPLWLRVPVGVSYGSDLEHVERVTLEVAEEIWREHSRARTGEEPVLRYREFDDSAITFNVRIMVDEYRARFRARHDFIKRLHARYAQQGIEIPWPIRTLSVPKPIPIDWRGDGRPSAARRRAVGAPAEEGGPPTPSEATTPPSDSSESAEPPSRTE